MNALPASIEAYLLEAGFSATEILILKRLLQEDALTLRQLAAKTGKSTGVLDQAMQKLLRKNIVTKETINDALKFTLVSLQAVSQWMGEDMKKKREEMTRRQQNFETFLSTLTMDKTRPEMQYFDGDDGIKQAYLRVLGYGKEMLQYVPVVCSAEDDPLRDFRVEYFRERHRRGIFSRVVAHNTPLGRRYQSRDPFEYRQTLLMPEDQYPFSFEKIIVGDTVTCINFMEKRACFIQYPELAHMERAAFEGIWKRETAPTQAAEQVPASSVPTAPAEPVVPLKIKTLSRLREFFLSKESLITLGIFAVVAGLATFGLYEYTSTINLQRIKDKVMSIAATGTAEFSADELNALRKKEDWKKPEWATVVNKLKAMRLDNTDILYAYIIRKTSENSMEFVSDSHSLNPFANTDNDPTNDVDANGDGKIDASGGDLLQWPGQPYLTPPNAAFLGYREVTASNPTEDQWGKEISGYAPILDSTGRTQAILAIDMRTAELQKLNSQTFTPLLYFFILFALFIFIRLAAFNRSLFKETWQVFQIRKVLIIMIFCAELAFGITFGFYEYLLHQTINDIGSRLMSIVATGASQINPNDLDQLHWAKDMRTDAYQRVFNKLNQIKNANPEITYIYIERVVMKPSLWEFVADSYSNYNLPEAGPDENGDGVIDEQDENVAPGVIYWNDNPDESLKALDQPSYEKELYPSQWGFLISGYAPIKDLAGKTHGMLGADIDISEVNASLHAKFDPWLWFTAGFSVFFLLYLLFKSNFTV